MRANEFLIEYVTKEDLRALTIYLDRFYSTLGLDIEFTRHFLDRVNDPRNGKDITVQELADLFKKEYEKYGPVIAKLPDDSQAVLKDLSTKINVPFAIDDNPKSKDKDIVPVTVMRKKDFRTSNREFKV